MSNTTTVTIRLDSKIKDKLDSLAEATQRSKSFLAAQAVTDYVNREAAILEGIEAGLEDMRAGRVIPHDQAIDRVEAIIEEEKVKKRAGRSS